MLGRLLKDNQIPDAMIDDVILVELKKKPFKVSTTLQFASYFDSATDTQRLFCSQVRDLKEEGGSIAAMKIAWREAESWCCH